MKPHFRSLEQNHPFEACEAPCLQLKEIDPAGELCCIELHIIPTGFLSSINKGWQLLVQEGHIRSGVHARLPEGRI